jgi:hypothetical protein
MTSEELCDLQDTNARLDSAEREVYQLNRRVEGLEEAVKQAYKLLATTDEDFPVHHKVRQARYVLFKVSDRIQQWAKAGQPEEEPQ